ncbi:MAG: FHA domain-containing protein [Acidobacteria bacterium]|nr:FHA domain-containing protein [Candidatus Sulfomarinibacter sp. MAG AM1]
MTKPEAPLPPMTLHVVTTDGSPFDHALEGESFVIGRSSKADMAIPDRSMSRMHARFYQDQGGWFVEDLGSRNGTQVGGRTVDHPARLNHGAVIQVGSTSITLVRFRLRSVMTATRSLSLRQSCCRSRWKFAPTR